MGRGLVLGSALCVLMVSAIHAQPASKSNHRSEVHTNVNLPAQVRVMTFNIHHGRGMDGKVNLDNIAAEIRKSRAQIVALQEVDRFLPRSGMRDQASKLASMLGMYSCYSASLDWGLGQYGNAILSRYPIVNHHVELMASPVERRSLLAAVVQIGSRRVTVFNTHLGLNQEERREQMAVIAHAIRETRGPAVLMGDFNMEPDNPLFAEIPVPFHKIHLRLKAPTLQSGAEIDHIFTNLPTGVVFAWTQPTHASDHHPVVADLPWK